MAIYLSVEAMDNKSPLDKISTDKTYLLGDL